MDGHVVTLVPFRYACRWLYISSNESLAGWFGPFCVVVSKGSWSPIGTLSWPWGERVILTTENMTPESNDFSFFFQWPPQCLSDWWTHLSCGDHFRLDWWRECLIFPCPIYQLCNLLRRRPSPTWSIGKVVMIASAYVVSPWNRSFRRRTFSVSKRPSTISRVTKLCLGGHMRPLLKLTSGTASYDSFSSSFPVFHQSHVIRKATFLVFFASLFLLLH